jgi:glycosyltransferase involved in cell wall biosynthesis
LRILAVHNYYGKGAPSGENVVADMEIELLKRKGHSVEVFRRDSDEIRSQGPWGVLKGACSTPWNPFSAKSFRAMIERVEPDIIHVHNTFPLISPSIFHSAGKKAPIVLSLHNYRLFCAAATLQRQENVCTQCIDLQSAMPALLHGCYRASRAATAPIAAGIELHRLLNTWSTKIDAFIALSDFQKNLMAQGGLPVSQVHVKPNFYAGTPTQIPWSARHPTALFVGRLTQEKGIRTLLEAWALGKRLGLLLPKLRVVGDGPLREMLVGQASGLDIEILGGLTREDTIKEVSQAKLLIVPSEWHETFGMVVLEAFAHGTTVAASNMGALPSLIQENINGRIFKPGNPEILARTIADLWAKDSHLSSLGREGRATFEKRFNSESNYLMLMNIYDSAIKNRMSLYK